MILITVGTQLPFDRLIRKMDEIAPTLGKPVFAQVGNGVYEPKNMEWVHNIDPSRFDDLFSKAEKIVSHAGIGTVLTAQRFGKPIVLIPRRATLGEHRNDHQLATVDQLQGRSGIYIAHTENELEPLLRDNLAAPDSDQGGNPYKLLLINRLRGFIETA